MRSSILPTIFSFAFAFPADAGCLDEAARFAQLICGEIEKSGAKTTVDATGKLSVNVSGIVKKAIGSNSGELSGKILEESYNGVLQDQLGAELFNVRECRQKMAGSAVKQACAKIQENEDKLSPKKPEDDTNYNKMYGNFTGFAENITAGARGTFSINVLSGNSPSEVIVLFKATNGLIGQGQLSGKLSADGRLTANGEFGSRGGRFDMTLSGKINRNKLSGKYRLFPKYDTDSSIQDGYFDLEKFSRLE